jgi:hypothetical protein
MNKVNMQKIVKVGGLAISLLFLSHASYAFDLSGAWTDNKAACGKIFEKKKGNVLSIKDGSGIYGDAFIVRQNSISSNAGTCTIKKRKTVGQVTHLVATCAAGNVALSTFQFSYQVKDENTIVRIFPGLKELDVTYSRCRF